MRSPDDEAAALHRAAAEALAAGRPLADLPKPAPPSARGYVCPSCGRRLRVIRTRDAAPAVVARRRGCRACGYRVTTDERPRPRP